MKQVIIAFEKRLTDVEIDSAVRGMSPRTFQALLQLLDDFARNASLVASGFAAANNALGMASEQGSCAGLVGFSERLTEMRS